MWQRSKFAIASSSIVLTLASGCAPSGAESGILEAAARRRPNVVLICWDTVRADRLGCYGHERDTTPVLDELARRSALFRDASSTAGWTKPSVPSFLTGTYPAQHGVYEGSARLELGEVTDTLPEASTTLAEVYRGAGYRTAAFVRNAQLRPGNGFEQGFDVYQDEAGDARSIRVHGLDWIDDARGSEPERPFFLYLHFLDAHWPFPVPDEYAQRYTDVDLERYRGRNSKAVRRAVNEGAEPWSADDRATLEALYDGALHYLDAQLGRLLTGLEQRGLAEDTIVCLVSDHGEEFGERGRLGHGHGLHESLLRVPWVLHVPGRKAREIDSPVSLIDLFPTLLTASGLHAPSGYSGVDALVSNREPRPVFAEHKAPDHYRQTLRKGRAKLERSFHPQLASDRDNDRLQIRSDVRWEAKFSLDTNGAWLLSELQEDDGDTDAPVELKGPIEAVENGRIVVAGVAAQRTAGTVVAPTDDAEDDELAVGRLVKLKLLERDGTLEALRIKVYALDAPAEHEVRGPLAFTAGRRADGTLGLGPFVFEVGSESDIEADVAPQPRMERAQVVHVLALGAGAEAADIAVDRTLWNVRGFAQTPTTDPFEGLDEELDAVGRLSVEARTFDDADRLLLTPDAVERLRAIGYGE